MDERARRLLEADLEERASATLYERREYLRQVTGLSVSDSIVSRMLKRWGKNVTLLASITAEGVGPCLAVEGPTTREVVETYLERVLAPILHVGQIVV